MGRFTTSPKQNQKKIAKPIFWISTIYDKFGSRLSKNFKKYYLGKKHWTKISFLKSNINLRMEKKESVINMHFLLNSGDENFR